MSFSWNNKEALLGEIDRLGLDIPFSEDVSPLFRKAQIRCGTAHNRIVFQPMEGCDGEADGAPGELTLRRYRRFARGGPGVLWLEAVSVSEDGRANPRQLWLHAGNRDRYRALVGMIKEECGKENGYEPLVIMQMTHSGRYAKPFGKPRPIVAYADPAAKEEEAAVTDDRLRELEECFAVSAQEAKRAGFDGVDVKCCHRYLASELLSAYHREGEYGGSFENRTRFYFNCVARAAACADDRFFVATRLNLYDGFAYPHGFGTAPGGGLAPDYREGREICRILGERYGVAMVNVTIGNPYVNPHVNRPYDTGGYPPPEPPLEGVARILGAAKQAAGVLPSLPVVASGLSYLRQYAPNAAAALIRDGACGFAGFGRMIFAYPDFIRDLRQTGEISREKCCITCSKCTELMRGGAVAGCVAKDEVYRNIYRQMRKGRETKE